MIFLMNSSSNGSRSQSLWVAMLGLLAAMVFGTPACAQDSSRQALGKILFADPFCCRGLDKWRVWKGEFPLDLYNRPGLLSWKNNLDFEATAGIATGALSTEDYQLRIELVRWPVSRSSICAVVRATTGEQTYAGYRVRIQGESAWLEKCLGEEDWRQAEMSVGPIPVTPEQFHGLCIQVYGTSPAKVRARIWQQAKGEPEDFPLQIEDAQPDAIRSGKCGAALWYLVEGLYEIPYDSTDDVNVTALEKGW
jgi:hypothetical protein